MRKVLAIVTGTLVVYTIITSWPEIVRYRRMMAM